MRNKLGLSDYLKSSCRSWEEGCDNEEDTTILANHLKEKYPELSGKRLFEEAGNWTGYNDKTK